MNNSIITSLNHRDIQLSYHPNYTYMVPNDMQKDYNNAIYEWQKKVKFNGGRAKPIAYHLGENILRIDACPFDYIQTRALQFCFSQPQYQHYVGLNGQMSSASITLSVLSHEGYLLHALRSAKVSKYPSTWNIGLGEGLEDKDFISGDLYHTVERCLYEELALNPEHSIKNITHFLSTHFEMTTGGLNILCLIDFTGLGELYYAKNILKQAIHAHDAWEHDKLVFLPLYQSIYQQSTIPDVPDYFSIIESYIQHK